MAVLKINFHQILFEVERKFSNTKFNVVDSDDLTLFSGRPVVTSASVGIECRFPEWIPHFQGQHW